MPRTVLLVEDELGLRERAREILEDNGFAVLETGDGESAIALSRHHEGPIDLLLTDVVLPAMQGVDLADAIRAQHPAVVVVYMSGYARDAFGEGGVRPAAFLESPFEGWELLRVLARYFPD